MKRKKILFLVEAFGGGVFTYIVSLSNELVKNYDMVIAYSTRNQTPKNFKNYFNKDIRFIEVKNFKRSIGLHDFKACREIKNIINCENPDIVHMHSSKAGIIGRIVCRDKKIKKFYTPHGYSFLKQDDSKFKRIIYFSIEKMVAVINSKCKIIACSEGEYKESIRLNKNSTYVNNGIDIDEINQLIVNYKNNDIDFTKLKICTIGRIGFQKNPSLFNQIAEAFPDFQFTWIGDGELRNQLISKNIKITGWANRNDVLKNVLENNIFLLPSLWEGLPIALLEAMYLGKVCIVSNVIGNRDVIKNGVNGFVCNNLEDFKMVINKIKNEEYEINSVSQKAKEDIIKEYNIKTMSEKYKNIYEKN